MPKASQVEGRFDSLALKHLSHFLPHVYNAQSLSRLRLFAAPRTAAHQAFLSVGSSSLEYWSGLPLPTPGDLHDPGIKPTSLVSPVLAGRFFTTSATW